MGAMTIKQFTASFGIGRTTVSKLIREGSLRSLKVGRRSLISKAEAARWLASLEARRGYFTPHTHTRLSCC